MYIKKSMKTLKFLFTICLLFICYNIFSQGTIRGKLVDEKTHEPLIGAIVQIKETEEGIVTDLDGSYSIQLPEGSYTVMHAYVGYQNKSITEVNVTNGSVNTLGEIPLGVDDSSNELEAVTITAEVQKNTEAGILNFQQNSSKIVDAVSAQSIAKTGDSDVAAVVKRVPGVTIEGGKYVYVRGLGDRYSKSVLNGLEIPGLDAEKNTVQMDIFPSNIIDNIVVYKTFHPDLPGDFSGGMIDVETRDFPDNKYLKAGVSFGFNSETTFSDDYILYEGQSGDLFGFGKSERQLPFNRSFEVNGSTAETLSKNTLALNNQVAAKSEESFLLPRLNLSYGNQIDINDDYRFGYNLALNYRQDQQLQPNYKQTLLQIRRLPELRYDSVTNLQGKIGSSETMLNAIGGFALKNDNNKYSLKLLHTRTGENEATLRTDNSFRNEQVNYESVLDYFQRTISNGILSGEHYLNNDKLFEWGNAFTYTTIDNPDRTTSSVIFAGNGQYNFTGSGDSGLSKEWRDLSEISNNLKANLEMPVSLFQEGSTLKFGLSSFFKNRDYDAYALTMGIRSINSSDTQNLATISDLDELLASENIYRPGQSGYAINNFLNDAPNSYQANMHVAGGYFMGDFNITDKLEFIGGLRMENAIMNYEGTDRLTFESINSETLNSTQFLPSANFVYAMQDDMNLRASFNRTLARPSFKEKSEAIIFDPITATTFYGDLDLIETEISNFDLRWEYFFESNEMISLSSFYKNMQNPIEYQALSIASGPDDITAVNKDEADLIGGEFELRKNLGFFGNAFKNFAFNGNFTYVETFINLSDVELSKYETAQIDAPKNRELLGQSPYTINAGLGYNKDSFQANVNYNVKGKTLSVIGLGQYPNVYEIPVNRLSAKIAKRIGANNNHSITLTGSNLLNQDIRFEYEFPGIENQEFNSFSPGFDLSLGYTYNFR